MVGIHGKIVRHILLTMSEQQVAEMLQQGRLAQSRPNCRSLPCYIVIQFLFVWKDGSSLQDMVTNRSLGQSPHFLLENRLLYVRGWSP